jgi:hypothetical protein
LEGLHDKVKDVRVIFAGRRLLARAGFDWEWSVSDPEFAKVKAYLPKRKDYLRLHEIRGFNNDPQALDGLDDGEVSRFFALKKLKLMPEMRAAILEKSVGPSPLTHITWHNAQSPIEDRRYNPFDLNQYADWLLDDPDIEPETIRLGGTDPHIQVRIVNRFKPGPLRKLLPAVILLRHFDKDMLRPIFRDREDFDEVYRQLADI